MLMLEKDILMELQGSEGGWARFFCEKTARGRIAILLMFCAAPRIHDDDFRLQI